MKELFFLSGISMVTGLFMFIISLCDFLMLFVAYRLGMGPGGGGFFRGHSVFNLWYCFVQFWCLLCARFTFVSHLFFCMQGIVKLVTWNVKGIGHVIKRKKILTFLKKECISIALLQETHLSDVEHCKLKRDWVGQIYYSSFTSNGRGVATLFHKDIPFSLEDVESDSEGRFALVSG